VPIVPVKDLSNLRGIWLTCRVVNAPGITPARADLVRARQTVLMIEAIMAKVMIIRRTFQFIVIGSLISRSFFA